MLKPIYLIGHMYYIPAGGTSSWGTMIVMNYI